MTDDLLIHSFAPIADAHARILILGSIPGVESLRLQQYYANPRNAFWRIMQDLLGESCESIVSMEASNFVIDRNSRDFMKSSGSFASGDPTGQTRYRDRIAMLLRHRIALWDVIEDCSRPGSLDSAIRNERINDFDAFFRNHPDIRHVYFNGTKAYDTFRRLVGFRYPGILWTQLPSTSPARTLPYEAKLAAWSILLGPNG